MLPAILSKAGLPVLLSIAAGVLSAIENPKAQEAAQVLSRVDAALKTGEITGAQLAEANRHVEVMARQSLEAEQGILKEINASFRGEVVNADAYVRRMRPTFGYMMAMTWAAQMLAIAYVIIFKTAQAGVVIAAMSSLSAIWTVGLSVLGIYVYKRSEEKKASAEREMVFWNQ